MAEASAGSAQAPARLSEADRDFTLRLFAAAGVSPVWVGAGIAAAFLTVFAGYFSYFELFERGSASGSESAFEVVNALLIAYLLTANAYALAGARRDLRELRPSLRCSDSGFVALARDASVLPTSHLHAASLLGLASGTALVLYDPAIWPQGARPSFGDPLFLWVLGRNALIGWCGFRAGVTQIALTRGFARLGRSDALAIDLLDPRPLLPFARKAQRGVAIWIGFCMLFSLFWLGDSAASTNVFLLFTILGFVAFMFLWPMLGVHRRILAAKREALDGLNPEIRREVEALGGSAVSKSDPSPRLANLIAYRNLVEGAREWPINATGLIRTALFVALGIGSWLGGALVERVLAAALD